MTWTHDQRNPRVTNTTNLVLVALLVTAAWMHLPADEPVTITVTDKVLVSETTRIGINLCSDNYWDSAILKMRAAENFEGLRFRMVTWGPQIDEHGIYVWFRPTWDIAQSKSMAGKVRCTFLGGPDKGKSGIVKDVRLQVCPADRDKREICYIEFEEPVTPARANQLGVLLEYDKPDHGSISHGSEHNWNSPENSVHIGDVPPGSFGKAALWLRGIEKEAYYNYAGAWRPMDEQNGTWRVRLWAKVKAGEPLFRLRTGGISGAGRQTIDLPLTATWKQHDLTIVAADVGADRNIGFELRCSGGEVLVDDVEIWKADESANPTVFRDLVVDPLKKLNPGILRYLQMGGSDLATNLRPPLKQMPWTRDWHELNNQGRNRGSIYPFNLHDFYVLCEHIGADPWYCLPGTLHPEEIDILMEYLGAPPTVGYGRIRAGLGHPRPWIEVFRNIYVEYGNEAWNSAGYATGSFNGPDHWKDMTAVGKASPHYRTNVIFVGGAQAGHPEIAEGVIRNAPNLDRVALAPYMLHTLSAADVAPLDTDTKLFKWVFGFADRRVNHERGEMRRNFGYAAAKQVELAIYEHNYHITAPSVKDDGAPIALRNTIIASLGGGINLVNDSLHMMRDLKVRNQCLFNLNQKQFSEGVKLWGLMPGLNVEAPRYRPSFLAMEIANRVIAGDMTETRHSPREPTFSAHGIMAWEWKKKPEFVDYGPLPTLRSYAFRNGRMRGMILVNLDTGDTHSVKLALPTAVKNTTARAWRLAADSISANNEYETGEPQVRITDGTLGRFGSGCEIRLPAHSMLVLKWEDSQ